jgi:hypothetical protein
MAEYTGCLSAAAVVAVVLAGCAEAMPENDSTVVTPGSYGISRDAGSHGSVYSYFFGSSNSKDNQSVADARVATPPAASSGSATVGFAQQATPSAATPATTAVAQPPSRSSGAYGIPSDAGSHGSVYSYLFGQNGKPPGIASAASEKTVPVTSYGIPADAGSHGSLYSLLFGSKDATATPSNGSTVPSAPGPTAPPAR